MFTIQIQCATFEDVEKIFATLKHSAGKDVVQQVASQIPAASEVLEEPAKPKNPRGRPRREVAEQPAASAESQGSAPAPESEPEVQTQQAPTLDDARAALKSVQAKYGTDDMAKPLEVLGQFSAGRISEVKPEQYPDFIAACKAA